MLGLAFPRRVNFSWSAVWSEYGVTWGNRLNWTSSRDRLAYAGLVTVDGKSRQNFKTTKLPSYWTLDTIITYKPSYIKGITLSVEMLNVLNQMRKTKVATSNADSGRMLTGREIWLNASYDF